ncbi:hypothetical protein Tco_0270291 [Tanacetum coccineum]
MVMLEKKVPEMVKWVKISIRKVHTSLRMEDNDEINYFLDYLCVDLNFVEEQRNNLMIKHRDIVQELNTCKEKLLELSQAKVVFLTIQHENTKILKENQTLREELKELTEITETWLNNSNKEATLVCSTYLPPLEKLVGVEPQTGPKTIKSILKSCSNRKAETSKDVYHK